MPALPWTGAPPERYALVSEDGGRDAESAGYVVDGSAGERSVGHGGHHGPPPVRN